jgi:deoxyribodipyrimidine photolyase
MKRIIHWFRRELRISDNRSLFAACRDADEVIPVYILSSWKRHHPSTGANRRVPELRDLKAARLARPSEEKLAPDYPLPMVFVRVHLRSVSQLIAIG